MKFNKDSLFNTAKNAASSAARKAKDSYDQQKQNKLSFVGYTFKDEGKYITYQSPYGKSFRVLKDDIESVSTTTGGFGKAKLQVNGKGTTLADVELPKKWAERAQEFIQSHSSSSGDAGALDDLEKLAELRDKGVITPEEFEAKKKQILGL